ncbi:MAG TPA: Ig-like domain-containing protein [Gemmatimonadales bacterium]
MKVLFGVTVAILGAAACGSSDMMNPGDDLPAVARVVPAAEATGVDPAAPIVVQFTHAMMAGMEQYVALHVGETPAGPVVDGGWTWSSDRTVLTFVPVVPLQSSTRYTIHLGGGLRDSLNREVNHGACAAQGGRTTTSGMMAGSGMMGGGWRHSNGTYGMLFSFTTA